MKIKPETRLVSSVKNIQTVHGANHSSFRVEWQVAGEMAEVAPIAWTVRHVTTVEDLVLGLEEFAARLRARAGMDEMEGPEGPYPTR